MCTRSEPRAGNRPRRPGRFAGRLARRDSPVPQVTGSFDSVLRSSPGAQDENGARRLGRYRPSEPCDRSARAGYSERPRLPLKVLRWPERTCGVFSRPVSHERMTMTTAPRLRHPDVARRRAHDFSTRQRRRRARRSARARVETLRDRSGAAAGSSLRRFLTRQVRPTAARASCRCMISMPAMTIVPPRS